jgi:toxin secretion/phage lysis holin
LNTEDLLQQGGQKNMGVLQLWLTSNHLEIAHDYLFGDVKYVDLLFVLMVIDVITGVAKAWKNKRLRSRNALYGYARKVLIFTVLVLANILDKIFGLNGALAYGTILFYIANESLSIVENLAQFGVKIPSIITDRLHVIQNPPEEEKSNDQTSS